VTDTDNHTRPSSFRIPTDLKKAAAAKAAQEGRTLTDVIVEFLRRYAAPTCPTCGRHPDA
jgi:hypothetical protein